ncbi:MAG: biotin--[acetyl-CoA-carboxylase] ligase [Burkholderiales bacterium]|nr:biotin--[acetyl-CoA-carboxylase] ligase [Burkholderiales bacterium]
MPGSPRPALDWHAESLRRSLAPLLPGIAVEVVARTGSTNDDLVERARGLAGGRGDDAQPTLRVAEQQTRGRGRMGRGWVSAPGASLTFSLALPLAPASWSGLSLAVGLAIADALDPAHPGAAPRVGIKWPNDLWLREAPGQGRKLGGILVETVAVGPQRMVVVGVGLNLLPLPDAGPAAFGQGFASLSEIDPAATAPGVLARVAPPLVQRVLAFAAEGPAMLAAGFAHRDMLAGQPVVVLGIDGQAVAEGVADGIDADGALRLRRADGVQAIVSGEVSVRSCGPIAVAGPRRDARHDAGPPRC